MSRRRALAVLGGAAAAATLPGCAPPSADLPPEPEALPPLPPEPVELTIFDVAGNLVISKAMMKNFQAAHPELVSEYHYLKAPATDVIGKIKAQQNAGRVSIDLVLTGGDGLSSLRQENMLIQLFPRYGAALPDLADRLVPGASKMHESGGGFGVVATYGPNGPLLEYAPKRVPTPPKTPQELLAWARQRPGRFCYPRPDNSGPGRTFLMALPYLLGDRDPKDPVRGWEKTWSLLTELDAFIDYYPSGTSEAFNQFAGGSRDIVVSTCSFDIGQRADGAIPTDSAVGVFDGFHWVADSHYAALPRGMAAENIPVVLKLVDWMLRPDQQALAYDEGFVSFPVHGVTDALASPKGRRIAREFGRPDFYPALFASHPVETPLESDALASAFDLWNRRIGNGGANR
ncbi:extracellular solute-binding protein [Saccharopolyspora sp. 5N708]|uniref:extracellular solute-binding protein n=1 Tax=Saccharopolyspora sp. 5N708 TaxID=3457424 RepID=UPI003FD61480